MDYRALNQIAINDRFPNPIVDVLVDDLYGSRSFLKPDTRSGTIRLE